MMHDRVLGIAGRIKHLEPRALLYSLGCELAAVHAPGDDYVGEKQIDTFRTIDDRQSLDRVAGGQRVVPETADLRDDVFADQCIVLDNQDGFVAMFAKGDDSFGSRRRDAFGLRQVKFDRRAVALLAVDLDMSVRLLDEA